MSKAMLFSLTKFFHLNTLKKYKFKSFKKITLKIKISLKLFFYGTNAIKKYEFLNKN